MEKSNFYKYAFLLMIGFNLLLLVFFVVNRPKHGPGIGNRLNAKELLHLTNSQSDIFLGLAQEHIVEMKNYSVDQSKLLQRYFSQLYKKEGASQRDIILEEVQQIERKKINLTYKHLQEVKNILTDDQLPFYEEFAKNAIGRILGDAKNSRPPPPK